MKDILLLNPPFTQLNTPYPATAYLKGFLNTKNISSFQMDLSIEVIQELFSKKNLLSLFDYAHKNRTIHSENASRIYALKDEYIKTVKGVTVEQVARVTYNFTESGIMVHAYLMYGFPTQTEQETVDSLEMVRQMFETGIIQSGFWHQFTLTTHSPICMVLNNYGIIKDNIHTSFANNDIPFKDRTGIEHDKFNYGLRKSLLNFMNGIRFELPLQDWFDFKIPKTGIQKGSIQKCLNNQDPVNIKPSAKIIWLGGDPVVTHTTKTKKGQTKKIDLLTFQEKAETLQVKMDQEKGAWFLATLKKLTIGEPSFTFSQLKEDFEKQFDDFELFWYSKSINILRDNDLLIVL